MGVRLGGWRRIMPFLFSLPPRRHELYGSAKLAIRTISNLTGAALSIRQRGGFLRFSGLR